MTLPRITITSGDPAGVGPELSLRVLSDPAVLESCVPVVLGDAEVFRQVAKRLELPLPPIKSIDTVSQISSLAPEPLILDVGILDGDEFQPGEVNASTGKASFAYIELAIRLALENQVDAIVTGPIHKEALHAAGVPFPGHTEILADRTKASRHCMMLTSEEITCSLVTAHVGLDEVPGQLTVDRIVDAVELSHEAMQRIRGRDVKLTVCGLNPHAGESGLFGNREEERIIQPAIDVAKKKGIDVRGPLPPDTAFMAANRERTDCYVCMYHDQGLIPLKALAFDTAVNVTLGLPIVRTSVDHGTALDIAWQGKASTSSFIRAIELAVKLAS